VGRTLGANRLLARSACGKRQRGRPLNSVVSCHEPYGRSTMTPDRFPNLKQFFGGYFHEDRVEDTVASWEAFAGTVEPENQIYRRAVSTFITREPAEFVSGTADELSALLDMPLADADLRILVQSELHANYHFDDVNDWRPWLQSILGMLKVSRHDS
jgi:CdiI immunity protein